MEERHCFECDTIKPLDYFYKRATRNADGNYAHAICMSCEDQNSLFWIDQDRKIDRWLYLGQYKKLGRYFHTRIRNYQKLFRKQGGRCAICKRFTHPKPLNVDHDHSTGKVRGLLCHSCNVRLGHWHDKPPHDQPHFIAYLSQ